MKNQIIFTISALILMAGATHAQTLNWESLKTEENHVLSLHAGIEHGAVFGLGYAMRIENKFFPFMVNIEYSFPSGDELLDDFKSKAGAHIRWIEFHHFQFSTKLHGVFRRFEDDDVRLVNFGSDLSGIIGYYRTKWFVAGEVGFDKAIITHFRHSHLYSDQYPGVKDGWYGPATGGNFYYGVEAGFSFGNHDLYARAGKILSQDFRTSPTFPLYGQLGYNIRL
jgi:hypothetical protein